MTSSPLFTRVAEFVVTTRPMSQVGWARACAGVTSYSSSLLRPRNGPPEAVTTSRRTSAARPPRRHCASAECSESTGTIWPGRAAAFTTGPPTISDSLLASASVDPARERGQRGQQADRAGDAVEHHVRRCARRSRWRRAHRRRSPGHTPSARPRGRRPPRPPRRCPRYRCRRRCGAPRRPPPAGRADPGERRPRRRAHHDEPVGIAADDVEGLGADRAGRSEDDHIARGAHASILAHPQDRRQRRRATRSYRIPTDGSRSPQQAGGRPAQPGGIAPDEPRGRRILQGRAADVGDVRIDVRRVRERRRNFVAPHDELRDQIDPGEEARPVATRHHLLWPVPPA